MMNNEALIYSVIRKQLCTDDIIKVETILKYKIKCKCIVILTQAVMTQSLFVTRVIYQTT